MWATASATHKQTTHKSLEFMVLASLPIGLTAAAFAAQIIDLFYGLTGYEQSTPVYQILLIGLPVLYVDFVLGTALNASDRQRELAYVSLAAIPVNILLNLVLIPFSQQRLGNGGIGSAAATVVTECGIMVAFLLLLPKGLLAGFRFGVVTRGIVACGVSAAGIWLLGLLNVFWPLQAVAGVAGYAVLLRWMGTFEPEEDQLIREVFTRRGIARISGFVRGRMKGASEEEASGA
jgi:O-antigen/teichoic acid export membrane protein